MTTEDWLFCGFVKNNTLKKEDAKCIRIYVCKCIYESWYEVWTIYNVSHEKFTCKQKGIYDKCVSMCMEYWADIFVLHAMDEIFSSLERQKIA